ncbi:MAG TPA: hypothetical protein PKX59_09300 [Bacteroidia bacterium]|nr:hypothetical protein [Bacteroidia bacterium]
MYLTLSRNTVLFIGIAILSFYYCLNKIQFILDAEITYGTVSSSSEGNNRETSTIFFSTKDSNYFFGATENVHYTLNQTVAVIYKSEKPQQAFVFSFLGFWYEGLLYCLIPLCLWCAFLLSFYSSSDSFILPFFAKSSVKQQAKNSTKDSAVTKQSP